MTKADLERQYATLINLRWEAYRTGLKRKAADVALSAAKVAQQIPDAGKRVRALFWAGASFVEVGERETALPILLEAANLAGSDIDPADTFNARCRLIEIALDIKGAGYILELLDAGRKYLSEQGKEWWSAKLDHLSSQLASLRGHRKEAYGFAQRGWRRRRAEYPYYTEATHLVFLCQCAFALGDLASIKKIVEEWADHPGATEMCSLKKQSAEALDWRATRRWIDEPDSALGLGRDILRRSLSMDGSEDMEELPGLRLLTLCGAFSEVERFLTRGRERKHFIKFAHRLFEGDFLLAQARSLAGMDSKDEEWDTDFPPPSGPVANPAETLAKLTEAETLYRNLFDLAAKEDTRLETNYYSATLYERLRRVETIRSAIQNFS